MSNKKAVSKKSIHSRVIKDSKKPTSGLKRKASVTKKVSATRLKNARVKRKAISKSTIQYVLPLGNGWVVKGNNAAKFLVITDSKREAITIARNLARTQKSQLIVHGKAGKVELNESYVAG